MTNDETAGADRSLIRQLLAYQRPIAWKSWWQLADTFLPFIGICVLMEVGMAYSYWITLALAPLAAGFVVRIFIIQHDCGHGSFFRSRRMNDTVGTICGVLTLTPYHNWRRQHANHHAKWNNLDRRDADVDLYSRCLTVREYQALNFWGAHALSRAAQPADAVHPAAAARVLRALPFPVRYPGVVAARAAQRLSQQSRDRRGRRRARLGHRLCRSGADLRADHAHCLDHRHLAVLRAAPVREHVVAAHRRRGA